MPRSVESRLRVTRQQILAYRRRVGALDERMPMGSQSLRRAAWAGLQDSMPRAALLSLHARIDGVESSTWEDPALAQLWGPRYHTYVVAKRDFALFSLGRLPDNAKSRLRAERIAERLRAHLDGTRMTDREVGRELGVGNSLRYAATTGTVAIRWEGARAPTVWTVVAADVDPADARRELARRYIRIFGPATANGFARWAGISRRSASDAFASLEASLLPVRSPLGDEWLLAEDEPAIRTVETAAAPRACCRAAMPTSCSMEQSGSFSFRARISDSVFGRPACGPARSSSKARSAELGDGRTTPYGSMPGHVFRAKRATRSRPRPTPCRSQASNDRSRWFGTLKQRSLQRAGS